jgi:transposase InsO family protein
VTFNALYVFFFRFVRTAPCVARQCDGSPDAAWAAQQVVEAIGADIVSARLIRDRDAIFGNVFDPRVDNLGLRQIRIAARCPWQNGYAERWIGTLRRELLDHVIVLGERHLLRLVRVRCLLQRGPTITCPSMATRRPRASSRRRAVAGASRIGTSADSITVTRGPRDLAGPVFRHER